MTGPAAANDLRKFPATTTAASLNVNAAIAWGVLFLILIAMTDIPATQPFAAAIAWLFFVSVALTFGPAAFRTIITLNKGATAA